MIYDSRLYRRHFLRITYRLVFVFFSTFILMRVHIDVSQIRLYEDRLWHHSESGDVKLRHCPRLRT